MCWEVYWTNLAVEAVVVMMKIVPMTLLDSGLQANGALCCERSIRCHPVPFEFMSVGDTLVII